MKIKFYSRISGYARVAYKKKELECQSYTVINPGDYYHSPVAGYRRCPIYAIQIDDQSVYELKPGSKVTILN